MEQQKKENYNMWSELDKRGPFFTFALYGSMFALMGGFFSGTIGLYALYLLPLVILAQLIDFVRRKLIINSQSQGPNSFAPKVLSSLFNLSIVCMAFFAVIGILVMTYNAFNYLEETKIFHFVLTHWNRGSP